MTKSNLHTAWARLFVRSLAACGVTEVVLSPGSRSTPLALAAAATVGLRTTVVLDERAAGFIALGIGRTTGRPVMLLCTSGTAGAHYLPALIEASLADVPIIAVTADRPWELQGCGASQTIDQRGLFGGFVRHAAYLGEPWAGVEALRAVPRVAAQSFARALTPRPGPVHVDASFRKPLEPVSTGPEAWADEVARLEDAGPPCIRAARQVAPCSAVAELVSFVRESRAPLVLSGPARPLERETLPAAVAAFAQAGRCLWLAEVTSGARFGASSSAVAGGPDELLGSEAFAMGHGTDLIVEVGMPPVSAAWARRAARGDIRRVVIGAAGLSDPHGTATWIAEADAADLLLRAAESLAQGPADDAAGARQEALAKGQAMAEIASGCITRALAAAPWTEGTIARHLVEALPEGAVLLVGNSGTVRELDTWGGRGRTAVDVQHQRGVAGIDGLVAGALGARLATDAEHPVVVLLGDVAAVHDLGALVPARRAEAPLVIVVVHNDGGRIFERLPIADRPELAAGLESLFVVPHGVSIAAVAESLGVASARVETASALTEALQTALRRPGATVVEAVVPPSDAGPRRRSLALAIDRAMAEVLR